MELEEVYKGPPLPLPRSDATDRGLAPRNSNEPEWSLASRRGGGGDMGALNFDFGDARGVRGGSGGGDGNGGRGEEIELMSAGRGSGREGSIGAGRPRRPSRPELRDSEMRFIWGSLSSDEESYRERIRRERDRDRGRESAGSEAWV